MELHEAPEDNKSSGIFQQICIYTRKSAKIFAAKDSKNPLNIAEIPLKWQPCMWSWKIESEDILDVFFIA